MNLDADHIRAALAADYAVQDARRNAIYTEHVMKQAIDRAKLDTRQMHRQHCEPEVFSEWSGFWIAVFIVGVVAVITIGSTIDYWGL